MDGQAVDAALAPPAAGPGHGAVGSRGIVGERIVARGNRHDIWRRCRCRSGHQRIRHRLRRLEMFVELASHGRGFWHSGPSAAVDSSRAPPGARVDPPRLLQLPASAAPTTGSVTARPGRPVDGLIHRLERPALTKISQFAEALPLVLVARDGDANLVRVDQRSGRQGSTHTVAPDQAVCRFVEEDAVPAAVLDEETAIAMTDHGVTRRHLGSGNIQELSWSRPMVPPSSRNVWRLVLPGGAGCPTISRIRITAGTL